MFVFQIFKNCRQTRNNNNRHNNRRQIGVGSGQNMSEIKSNESHASRPKDSTEQSVKQKSFECQVCHAGQSRAETAHNRDETANDYCFSAIFFEKLVSVGDIFWIENFGFVVGEKPPYDSLTKKITEYVAGRTGYKKCQYQNG
jgi:hypothetical protein